MCRWDLGVRVGPPLYKQNVVPQNQNNVLHIWKHKHMRYFYGWLKSRTGLQHFPFQGENDLFPIITSRKLKLMRYFSKWKYICADIFHLFLWNLKLFFFVSIIELLWSGGFLSLKFLLHFLFLSQISLRKQKILRAKQILTFSLKKICEVFYSLTS